MSSSDLAPLPDLDELLAWRGAAQFIALKGRALARAPVQGTHRSAHRGRGLEFQEVRPYVPGDDPRTIDWRVTARRGRPHTKLFREERERAVWLLVDLDAALFFGTRRQLKSAASVRTAALLAWAAALGGDRVGAMIAGAAEGRIVEPRAREAGVLPLLAALVELQPTAPGRSAPDHLNAALRILIPLVRPGSLILLVSDFAQADEDTGTLCAELAAHADCRLFWITDPVEEQALPDGRFRAAFPGRARVIDGTRVRERWLAAWRERESRVRQLAGGSAAALCRLDTAEDVGEALRRFLPSRRFAA